MEYSHPLGFNNENIVSIGLLDTHPHYQYQLTLGQKYGNNIRKIVQGLILLTGVLFWISVGLCAKFKSFIPLLLAVPPFVGFIFLGFCLPSIPAHPIQYFKNSKAPFFKAKRNSEYQLLMEPGEAEKMDEIELKKIKTITAKKMVNNDEISIEERDLESALPNF
jgi:hypothetical protein